MRNLRSANEFAAQRKKRNIWRNVVTCIAAFVVFCTTYALILPAITMEKEDLSCGLEEHAHSSACYQLTCSKQEVYSHTHTKDNCYNSDGALICTLREQTAHHHTQDCYSKPQPACGQVEHAAHTHGDDCYTEGELTCILAVTPGHAHSDACYPADFTAQLVCGKQDLPEHRHSDACYIRVCGKEEHAHTDACADSHQAFIENLDQLAPTADEQPTASEAVTQPEATGAEASEAPTETEAATQPEAQTEAPTETEAADQEETETPTQEETEGDVPEQTEAALLLAAPRMASDGNPERLVDVADYVHVSARLDENGELMVSYNKETGEYEASLGLDFKLKTALGANGYYVTGKDGDGLDYGTEFILSLGEIKVGDGLLNTTFYLKEGQKTAGTYQFVREGEEIVLKISLLDDYVSHASTGITGEISLNGKMGKKETNDQGNLVYPVDGDVDLVIPDKDVKYPDGTSAEGDILVTKSGSYSYSEDGRTLTYTVTLQSKEGTPDKVHFEDTLTFDGISISELASVKVGDQYVTDYTYSIEGSKATISMELDKLEPGAWKQITYVYKLSEAPSQNTIVNNAAKGSSKDIEYEYTYPVEVPTDPTKPTEPPATDPTDPTTPTEPIPSMAKHNGWKNPSPEESNNQQWNFWRIVVNDNGGNIADVVARDDEFSKAIKLWFKIRNENGGYDILPESEWSKHFDLDLENNKLTFKATSEDGTNRNAYEIHYTTDRGTLGDWGYNEVSNTFWLGERAVTGWGSDNRGDVSKKGENLTFGEDKLYHMDWTATITIGLDGIPTEHKIADLTLPYGDGGSAKHYYERGSLKVTYNGYELDNSYYSVTYYDKSGDGRVVTDGDSTYMEITMLKDPSASENFGKLGFVNGQRQDDKLVLTYRTYAKPEEAWGGGQWVNKVEYRTKSDTDTVTFTPPSFSKTDGNGHGGETTVENLTGELTWKVKTSLSSISKAKELTITDNLPEHVHVLGLKVSSQPSGGSEDEVELSVGEDGTISGQNENYIFSGTCKMEDGSQHYTVRLTVTNKQTGEILGAGTAFVLTLNCQIDENYLTNLRAADFKNTATGTTDEENLGGSEHTQKWVKYEDDPYEGALTKKGLSNWNKENQTIDYRLQINAKGADLQPGSSKVYLADEFTYDSKPDELELIYNLVRDSVKLYYVQTTEDGEIATDEKGRWVKGDQVTSGWRWTADEDNPGSEYGSSVVTKIIRLEVPDSTPLILEYSYSLDHYKEGKTGFNLGAKNKAYFIAHPDRFDEDSKEWTGWEAAASQGSVYTSRSLTITKVAENDSSVALEGVKFHIFKATQNEDGTALIWEGPITLTAEDGTTTSEYVTDYTGNLVAKFADGYQTNVLYKLEEVATVDGYYLPEEDRPSVMFYFKEGDGDGLPTAKYLYANARNLAEQSAFETISNTPNIAEFSVEKLWRYEDGSVADPITDTIELKVMRIATEVRQDTSVSDPLVSTAKVILYGGQYYPHKLSEFTVPKGAVLTIQATNCSDAKTKASTFLPGGSVDSGANPPAMPKTKDGTTWTYELRITHNICFAIATDGEGEPQITYSYTGQTTGDSGGQPANVLEVKEIEPKIILRASEGWKWKSTNLPIRGEVTKDGVTYNAWFTYYVVEASGNYETQYTNYKDGGFIGVSSGNITLTNILPPPPVYTQISIDKKWEGFGQLDYTQVRFKLIQKEWDHEPTEEELKSHDSVQYDGTLSAGLSVVYSGTLTADNQWHWDSASENLRLLSSYNGKYYTYFIVEESGDYTVSDSGQALSGTLTVINTTERKPTSIEVDKQWFDYFGNDVTQDRQGKISFELHRVTKLDGAVVEGSDTLIGTYDVSQADTPAWKWSSKKEGLILYSEEITALTEGEEKVKVTYEYYVVELEGENTSDVHNVEYVVSSGTITIKNTLESPKYELPKTGGTGTLAYTLAGLLLTLTSALALTQKRRKGVS